MYHHSTRKNHPNRHKIIIAKKPNLGYPVGKRYSTTFCSREIERSQTMDALAAILSRRSIRRFTDQPIPDDLLEQLLQAAMSAPSAHNEQPWHFIVIKDRQILDQIPEIHPYARMLMETPLALCVCADHNLEKDQTADYWTQDCAAATQNILIAAHALGLGACWLGIHPRPQRIDAIKKLLQMPDNTVPFSLIALGRPAETKPPSNRFKTDRIHQNHW